MVARYALLSLVLATGCGDPPARVTLAPIGPEACRPSNATGLRVIAFATSGERIRAVGLDEVVDIADFPVDTEQLGVEVTIAGGVLGAIGKTGPIAFTELADGDAIPVFMAPPNDVCSTVATMTEVRVAPLVARAGEGVLIVGGQDGAGNWLSTAEYYDPATSTFVPIAVPEVLGVNGFAGAALATLPDGRVAVSGGPQPVITLFDPQPADGEPGFGESVLIESRAFHASIAVDDDQVMLAAGCSDVAAGLCSGGVMRKSSKLYDTANLGVDVEVGPNLRIGRIGGSLFDIGIQDTGQRAFVLAGGVAPMGVDVLGADRMTLADLDAIELTQAHAQAALLDGGAVLTAFAPDADPASGVASVIAPGVDAARAIAKAPDLTGVRLIGLEDGRVLGIGGDPTGAVQLYDPTSDRWQRVPSALPALIAPSLVRLADGSVLVLGGSPASATAWVFRPPLLGPQTGSVTVVPSGTTATVLTAVDPATVTRLPDWQLTGVDTLARALVGGPRMATGSMRATVRVREGGVALLAQHLGPGSEVVAEVVPGATARIVRRTAGVTNTLCSGREVPVPEPDTAIVVRLAITSSSAQLFIDDIEYATCAIESSVGGAWGVAALAASRVTVETVTVAR